MTYAGAAVDGPAFGRNLVSATPYVCVPYAPPPAAAIYREPDEAIEDFDFSVANYQFIEEAGLWTCEGMPTAKDAPEPDGYPTVAHKWTLSDPKRAGNRWGLGRDGWPTEQLRSRYIKRRAKRIAWQEIARQQRRASKTGLSSPARTQPRGPTKRKPRS